MILAELKTYLSQRGRAALVDMAIHFNSDPDAIRGMLDHYIRKGWVQRLNTGTACGGCNKCDAFVLEIYEWTDGAAKLAPGGVTDSCQLCADRTSLTDLQHL